MPCSSGSSATSRQPCKNCGLIKSLQSSICKLREGSIPHGHSWLKGRCRQRTRRRRREASRVRTRVPSRRTHGAGGVRRGGATTRQQWPAEARPSGRTQRRQRQQPPVLPRPKTTMPPRRPAAAPRLGLRVAEVHPTRGAAVPFAQTLGASATVRGAAAALS